MSRLKLNLYDNAISFAEEALEKAVLAEKDSRQWKYAILNIVHSIELSLKEALQRNHPFLIYDNVDKPPKTVTLDQATKRLKRLNEFELSDDEQNALRTASKARNSIIHHEVDEDLNDLKLVFARLLGFLNDFHGEHLKEHLQSVLRTDLWSEAAKIRDYGSELYQRARVRMEEDEVDDSSCLITCPKCGWEALSLFGDNQERCYVCHKFTSLASCNKCGRVMLEGDGEEWLGKQYCESCWDFMNDDYWHDIGR